MPAALGDLPTPVMGCGVSPAQWSHQLLSLHMVGLGWGGGQQGLGSSCLGCLPGCWAQPCPPQQADLQLQEFSRSISSSSSLSGTSLPLWGPFLPHSSPHPAPCRVGDSPGCAQGGPTGHILPRLSVGCHPCAADLGCTSPSLSVQPPILPALSSSLSENDLASPTEPPAAPAHELRPMLPGSPAGTSPGRARHVRPSGAAGHSLCSRCALASPSLARGSELPGWGGGGDLWGSGAAPDTPLSAGSTQTWPLVSTAPSWLTAPLAFPQTPPSTPGEPVPPALPQALLSPLPFPTSPVPSGPSSPLSPPVTSTPWSPTAPLLSLANVFSLAVMSVAHTLLPAVSSIASSGGHLYPSLLPRPQSLVLGPPRFVYPDPASMAKPAPACGGTLEAGGADVPTVGGPVPFPPLSPAPLYPTGSEAAGSPLPSLSTSTQGSLEGSTVSTGVAGAPQGHSRWGSALGELGCCCRCCPGMGQGALWCGEPLGYGEG